METPRPFEITVGTRALELTLGQCAVALFRTKQEVSYIAVDLEDDETLRIFNNQEHCEYMAGYSVRVDDTGEISRPTKRLFLQFEDEAGPSWQTFRERYGWNPAVIERETPSDNEVEMWVEVNTRDLDEGVG